VAIKALGWCQLTIANHGPPLACAPEEVESKVKRGESTDQQGATFVFQSQQSRDNDLTYTDPGSPLGIEIYFACRSPAFGKLSYCVVVFCV
jgi:hypothetical protein